MTSIFAHFPGNGPPTHVPEFNGSGAALAIAFLIGAFLIAYDRVARRRRAARA